MNALYWLAENDIINKGDNWQTLADGSVWELQNCS